MRLPLLLPVLLMWQASAQAEFRRISIDFRGEECVSCAGSMVRSLQKLRGVTGAAIRAGKATIDIELAEANRISLGEVRDAIKRVGFRPDEARAVIHGEVVVESGTPILKPSGLSETYRISGEPAPAGKVILEGTIPPGTPGVPDTVLVRSAQRK